MKKRTDGFTLIELLVVIAVIGILAGVILASLNSARAKGRDARKMADFKNISTALQLYYDTNGTMPPNYFTYGINNEAEGGGNYEQSMQLLVSGGFLPAIPKSPGGRPYSYYNYGAGNSVGAIMVTDVEAAPATTTGIGGSCRYWDAGTNWCDKASNKYYCVCNPY